MVLNVYSRPTSSANPNWANAEKAIDLVPALPDPDGMAAKFTALTGHFMMTQGDAAGSRLEDVWLPWQEAALKASFQVRETMWVLGKGSGKTVSIAAFAIGFVMLSFIREINHRGLVAILASSIPTAKICFDHIQHAILADDELRVQYKTNVQSRSITHMESGITIQVLSCSMDAAVGRRPCLLVVDELHEVSRINGHKAVIDQLKYGGRNWGAEFKTVYISTMPPGKLEGEFKRLYEYGRRVRSGEIDDPDFLPLFYCFPIEERPDLSPLDPEHWWRGCPSLTTPKQRGTMNASELERELRTAAQAEDTEGFTMLLSQRLGIERDATIGNAETVLHGKWFTCPVSPPGIPNGASVAIGLDAGGVDDPAALAVIYERLSVIQVQVIQYLTKTGYARGTENLRGVYDEAVEVGTLLLFDSIEDLETAMIAQCMAIKKANWGSTSIGGDEHGRAGFKAKMDYEIGGFISVPQTYILGASLNALEAYLADGKLHHNACPLLDDNVRNLLVEEMPNGNKRLKKRDDRLSGQGYSKIDGIIAVLNAMQLFSNQVAEPFSVGRLIG